MADSSCVTVIGAASLKGKELGSALKDRQFPTRWTRLLDEPGEGEAAEHRLTEFGDEAALLDTPSAESLAGSDVIFFAGDAAQTEKHWDDARRSGALLVDLSGYAEGEAGSLLFGPDPQAQCAATPAQSPRIAALPHPAALLLVRLLTAAAQAGPIESATATVFEPVSERGMAGIQELQQQTLSLLTFKSAPSTIFGSQLAFNLKAGLTPEVQPTLAGINARIASQARQLLAQSGQGIPAPALCLLQAPVFHAHIASVFVRFAAPAPAARLRDVLSQSPAFRLYNDDEGQPDALSAAGENLFQLGQPVPDASISNGYWLFASFDNLRVAALHAVDVASALLQMRESRP